MFCFIYLLDNPLFSALILPFRQRNAGIHLKYRLPKRNQLEYVVSPLLWLLRKNSKLISSSEGMWFRGRLAFRTANISHAESKQNAFAWHWMIFWQLRSDFLLSQNACVSTPSFIACSRDLASHWVLLEMPGAGEGGQLVKILLLLNFFQWLLPWRASNETDLY